MVVPRLVEIAANPIAFWFLHISSVGAIATIDKEIARNIRALFRPKLAKAHMTKKANAKAISLGCIKEAKAKDMDARIDSLETTDDFLNLKCLNMNPKASRLRATVGSSYPIVIVFSARVD